jgi:L-asparaginase II
MLATCVHCGDATAGYFKPDHAHQQRIAKTLSDLTHAPIAAEWVGVDGCSAPNWPIALRHLARAFARFVTGEGLAAPRAAAAQRIMRACWAEPELVAGSGRLDTQAMSRLGGKVFMKTGAEGVYCGGFPQLGLGFAMKIDDGTARASHAAMSALLCHRFPEVGSLPQVGPLKNWRGIEVGEIRGSAALMTSLEALRQ